MMMVVMMLESFSGDLHFLGLTDVIGFRTAFS
jgi:hypothetical protein